MFCVLVMFLHDSLRRYTCSGWMGIVCSTNGRDSS